MIVSVEQLKQLVKHLEKKNMKTYIVKLEGHLLNIYFDNSIIHIGHVDSKLGVTITTKEAL